MTRSGRLVAPVLLTAALTAALAACSGMPSTGAGAGTARQTVTAVPTTGGTPTPTSTATGTPTDPTSPSPSDGRTLVAITVAGGKVSGATGRVKIPLGSEVTLQVTSDVADEVHLHGYDQHVDVSAGGTAALVFTADVPGVFEVELEQRALQLVQLQVQ